MKKLRLTLQANWVKEMLAEIGSLLELNVDCLGHVPRELRERLLQFLKCPSELVSFDCKTSAASGADECRIILKPSDGLLNLLLALRAWNRERNVAV